MIAEVTVSWPVISFLRVQQTYYFRVKHVRPRCPFPFPAHFRAALVIIIALSASLRAFALLLPCQHSQEQKRVFLTANTYVVILLYQHPHNVDVCQKGCFLVYASANIKLCVHKTVE